MRKKKPILDILDLNRQTLLQNTIIFGGSGTGKASILMEILDDLGQFAVGIPAEHHTAARTA